MDIVDQATHIWSCTLHIQLNDFLTNKQKYLLAVIVIYAEIATMCTECTLHIITAESDPIYENHIETD